MAIKSNIQELKFLYARVFCLAVVMLCVASGVFAQEKQVIQIKTFDQNLQVLRNVEVSLNNKEYVSVGSRGVAIVELNASDLPIKTIKIKDEKLEAASWNFSKGIVEVIIRAKNYSLVHIAVRFPDGAPVSNYTVIYKGSTTITSVTNRAGEFDLPLPLNEKSISMDQFTIKDLVVNELNKSEQGSIIIVDRPRTKEPEKKVELPSTKDQLKDFDLTRLDSIQSLTVFYAAFKNIPISSLSPQAKAQVDAKFNQLVAKLEDSLASARRSPDFIGNISDSSFVTQDIQNLLSSVTLESEALINNRSDFENKINVIVSKLDKGVGNLSAGDRQSVLNDLDHLEQLLIQNESRFYQNQNDYREIINTLREKYLDVEKLETQLSDAENRRLEEERIFRQRLFVILGILIVFGVLIVLLISFSGRLRRQAKDLKAANEEVKTINENLEEIVIKRTQLLEASNKELDTFLYRASHDLRAPIRSILGLCSIMDHIPQDEFVTRLERVTTGMDRMLSKLIDNSEINQESSKIATINLSDTIREVEKEQEKYIRESGVQFHIDCPKDITLRTSPMLIESILSNLVENAVFFSSMKNPDHARVEIKAQVNGQGVELSVYDNGIGIDDSLRPQLFNMFFTGHELSKGNGLGLYTVQRCVRALSGNVVVESEVGRYTKFKISLPYTI